MKKTEHDKKVRWKYYVAVGTVGGKIGLGVRCGKNKEKTFKLAVANAKKGMIRIPKSHYREDDSGNKHTLPRSVTGKYGKLRASADPAPRGTGIAHPLARVFFNLAGIEDCLLKINSDSAPLGSIAMLLFFTLKTLKLNKNETI